MPEINNLTVMSGTTAEQFVKPVPTDVLDYFTQNTDGGLVLFITWNGHTVGMFKDWSYLKVVHEGQ